MPGAPLELHEREEIFRALVEDPQASWAAVARRVQRHASTVAREVARGGGAWRRRGRCGTGSPQSCAWGVPPRRSAPTSSLAAQGRLGASR